MTSRSSIASSKARCPSRREAIEDDQYGTYSNIFRMMGSMTAVHPDEMVFPLLAHGHEWECYDGQYFFDADHPVTDETGNVTTTVSNNQTGAGLAWFLLDTSKPIKPLIFQERIPYVFQSMTQETDETVFMRNEFLYGVRARVSSGYGLWQMAYRSKAELNEANYEAARSAMQN